MRDCGRMHRLRIKGLTLKEDHKLCHCGQNISGQRRLDPLVDCLSPLKECGKGLQCLNPGPLNMNDIWTSEL